MNEISQFTVQMSDIPSSPSKCDKRLGISQEAASLASEEGGFQGLRGSSLCEQGTVCHASFSV